MEHGHIQTRLRPHATALAPGLVVVGLMLVWAAHDGGYDADTWYWGALVLLTTFVVVLASGGLQRLRDSRIGAGALAALGLYVAWSYLSMAWAQSPGDALGGSNRALLYLLAFAVLLVLPWTPRGAFTALLVFVLGVGAIGIVILIRLASGDHVAQLVVDGRLAAPTGYLNATAALFTIDALAATVLAARRELPALLRGVLIAVASAGLQLAVLAQSRGWLFTLPLIAVVSIAVVPDRFRVLVAATIPVAATLAALRLLLHVYSTASASGPALSHAATRAGQAALLICGVAVLAGALTAWAESRFGFPPISRKRRRAVAAAVSTLALAGVCLGATTATHGHPLQFISRQWRGFSHPQSVATGSHFSDVGSGRYDIWRASLGALGGHPVGGLGQDNFADYYVKHRHTTEEPNWTHSLELRLLAHTGLVGSALFAAFLIAASAGARRVLRRRPPSFGRAVGGVSLLPLVVWLIHGSVDWFWEMPALTVPALGFLAIAIALGEPGTMGDPPIALGELSTMGGPPRLSRRWAPRGVVIGTAAIALLAAATVLGLPYLSVREVSLASDTSQRNPTAALSDLARAAALNPLSSEPGRLAGAIALSAGQYREAERRFGQSISREPGGWFAWLGHGLAASALGNRTLAHHDFVVAASINALQPAVPEALARVYSSHPLSYAEALRMLQLSQ